MNLSTQTLSLISLGALVLSVFALVGVVMVTQRKRLDSDEPIHMDEALEGLLAGHASKIARLEQIIRKLAAEDRRQNQILRGTVQHVGMVRYDAFEDVGGRLSFSCALLDDRGDGVVITSINGRQDTRVYAKPIKRGESSHNLSAEEDSAIQQALQGPREAVTAG